MPANERESEAEAAYRAANPTPAAASETIAMSDEIRRDLRLPGDCGVFDSVRNVWLIRMSELQWYRPDIYRQCEGDDSDE